jgi:hypothetical protein
MGEPSIEDVVTQLELVMQDLATVNNGAGRCREYSLAYTALQEAWGWLVQAGLVNHTVTVEWAERRDGNG